MIHKINQLSLEQLITQLKATPKNAASIFSEHNTLWQSLGFSQAQVALWLSSLSLQNQQKEQNSANQVTPDIAGHLLSLLQQAGGRMPLAQVLKRLPAGITTSEQHIRKLAQQHAQFDIKGPLLVLVN
ncbi:hypothetical protein ACMUMS_13510 [Acinetobacter courvalinii]|uniref:hypothetical protein n=1 Tax=Acinetobacter courvalinii TaxID=280147 RepID=UPI003A857668